MENLKKERSVIRRLFTKTANELEAAIAISQKGDQNPEVLYSKLKELSETLFELDTKIKDVVLAADSSEEDLEKELLCQYEYKAKWLCVESQFKRTSLDNFEAMKDMKKQKRSFKLPKLELQVFDGELKNWITFWSQFSKIHEDKSLDLTEKYQYLLQSMKVDSEPRLLVEGFPATAYEKCIEQLKSRYAREDLLIQVYIRELLALVLVDKKENLRKLYDQLTAHLRALETLKVTTDNYAAFLLPMVESALPNDILKLWERIRDRGHDVAEELNNLLEFLRKEVESEQRLEISKKTFNSNKQDSNSEKTAIAECLVSNIKNKLTISSLKCIWCDKDNHASVECYKLKKFTLEDKIALLKQKKACSICLRKGHHPKIYRANIKCLICDRRHSTVLCPEKKEQKDQKEDKKALALASTAQTGETLLQTLIVELECGGRKQKVRALLDSGSQRSYVKKEIVEKMKIPPAEKEVLTHILFGGVEAKSKEFNIYNLNVHSLNNSYKLEISAICQKKICGHIPKINSSDSQLNNLLNVNQL